MNIYSSFFHNFKNWKQPKCPSAAEGIKELAPPHDGRLFNNKNKMNYRYIDRYRHIMLSARSHIQRATCCMIPFLCYSRNTKFIGTENSSVIAEGWWWGKGLTTKEQCSESVSDELCISIVVVGLHSFVKVRRTLYTFTYSELSCM